MDLNKKYAAHQKALMSSTTADSDVDRRGHLAKAQKIAGEIGTFQLGLGAAAACAWCALNLTAS
jgi:hypothetical protein